MAQAKGTIKTHVEDLTQPLPRTFNPKTGAPNPQKFKWTEAEEGLSPDVEFDLSEYNPETEKVVVIIDHAEDAAVFQKTNPQFKVRTTKFGWTFWHGGPDVVELKPLRGIKR